MPQLVSEVQLISASLLAAGFLSRGAIVAAGLHHADGDIFGPALVEAHRLESTVAYYPRVLIADSALPLVRHKVLFNDEETHFRSVRWDADGLAYLDILGYRTGTENEPRHRRYNEVGLLAAAEARYAAEADPRYRAKHGWMVSYLEAVVAELSTSAHEHQPAE